MKIGCPECKKEIEFDIGIDILSKPFKFNVCFSIECPHCNSLYIIILYPEKIDGKKERYGYKVQVLPASKFNMEKIIPDTSYIG